MHIDPGRDLLFAPPCALPLPPGRQGRSLRTLAVRVLL